MFRYIPNTREDQEKMLAAVGAGSMEELFSDIPGDLKLRRELDLPQGLSEPELVSHIKRIASENKNAGTHVCFLGAGVYDHFIPSVVSHIISRSEFYTSYTPYQPEISQGMLQSIFEYQTMICRLTGMDVSNASMYDGATAAAEAALMAVRSTGRNRVLVSGTMHPQYREVLGTYAAFTGIEATKTGMEGGRTDMEELERQLSGGAGDAAAVMVQSPNFFGLIEDMDVAAELAHKHGALLIACVDLISLAILQPPGEYGADITAGDGQPLGNPMNFGGPHFGFLAAKKELVRKMPGRIVGQTTDRDGRRGFVLTLQAREQHIRREKAVSNICSNQALNALAATVYLSVMGKQGLKDVAELCLSKSHYAYSKLLETGKFEKVHEAPFFREFVIRAADEPVESINRRLLDNGIIGGLDLERYYPEMKNCWLVAVTEKRTREEIDAMVELAAGGVR